MTAPAAAVRSSATFSLARRELRRFLINPVFLLGVALAAFGVLGNRDNPADAVDAFVWLAAIFLGGFGMMAAYWQTRSMNRSAEVVDVAPISLPARAAALCACAFVPFLLAAAMLVVAVRLRAVAGDGAWSSYALSDQAATQIARYVLPALTGPLLGVALGRWIRFPGIAFVAFLLLYGWATLGYVLSAGRGDALVLHMVLFAPVAYLLPSPDSGIPLIAWYGTPWLFVGWQLCLSTVAVLVAMLRGADGIVRRRIVTGLIASSALGLVMYVLTVAL
jgi:hypothetical protein